MISDEAQQSLNQDLIKSIKQNDLDGVKNALNRGASPNAESEDAVSALVIAVNIGTDGGDTPRPDIVAGSEINIVKLLIKYKADLDHDVDNKCGGLDNYDNNGSTALTAAVGRNALSTVRLLIQKGASLDSKTELSEWSAIGLASACGYEEMVKELLYHVEVHAIEQRDNADLTCLERAVYEGHTETVKILLKAGANVDPAYEALAQLENAGPGVCGHGEDHTKMRKLIKEAATLETRKACWAIQLRHIRALPAKVALCSVFYHPCNPLRRQFHVGLREGSFEAALYGLFTRYKGLRRSIGGKNCRLL